MFLFDLHCSSALVFKLVTSIQLFILHISSLSYSSFFVWKEKRFEAFKSCNFKIFNKKSKEIITFTREFMFMVLDSVVFDCE
jgi:hypothetical protein